MHCAVYDHGDGISSTLDDDIATRWKRHWEVLQSTGYTASHILQATFTGMHLAHVSAPVSQHFSGSV